MRRSLQVSPSFTNVFQNRGFPIALGYCSCIPNIISSNAARRPGFHLRGTSLNHHRQRDTDTQNSVIITAASRLRQSTCGSEHLLLKHYVVDGIALGNTAHVTHVSYPAAEEVLRRPAGGEVDCLACCCPATRRSSPRQRYDDPRKKKSTPTAAK